MRGIAFVFGTKRVCHNGLKLLLCRPGRAIVAGILPWVSLMAVAVRSMWRSSTALLLMTRTSKPMLIKMTPLIGRGGAVVVVAFVVVVVGTIVSHPFQARGLSLSSLKDILFSACHDDFFCCLR